MRSTLSHDLDLLGLAPYRHRSSVRFGDIDVGYAATSVTSRSTLGTPDEVDLQLRHSLLAGTPVDYLAPLEVGVASGDREQKLFAGNVRKAVPEGDVVAIQGQAMSKMLDRPVGPFAWYLSHQEVIYTLARLAGQAHEHIVIPSLAAQTRVEAIEVVTPVTGVSVSQPWRIGDVWLLPREAATGLVEPYRSEQPTAQEFAQAATCAATLQVDRLLIDAERAGIARIDAALAWLTVRARYGLVVTPDGRPQSFAREAAVAKPARGKCVIVRGLVSQRAWFRGTDPGSTATVSALDSDATWRIPDSAELPIAERQAILACARAATAADPVERILSIWDAIEFYVQGTQIQKQFAKSDIRRVRESLPSDLPAALRTRVDDLIADINKPSLRLRLRETLRLDAVPIADTEIDLLNALRQQRNDAVHGRTAELPADEDIDHAVSVVARMLLHRLHRPRQAAPGIPAAAVPRSV